MTSSSSDAKRHDEPSREPAHPSQHLPTRHEGSPYFTEDVDWHRVIE
jgi:hypothetical protein